MLKLTIMYLRGFIVLMMMFGLTVSSCTGTFSPTPGLTQVSTVPVTGGENAAVDPGSIGTTIFKPKPPTLNIFPDFEENIFYNNFNDDKTIKPDDSENGDDEMIVEGTVVSDDFVREMLAGRYKQYRSQSKQFSRFGAQVAKAFLNAGITDFSETEQQVEIDLINHRFLGAQHWNISARLEVSGYVRFYFQNLETGFLQATYLVLFDDFNIPIRSVFAYVNAKALDDDTPRKFRLVAMAFDFSDPNRNVIIKRTEKYYKNLKRYVVSHVLQQCNEVTGACVGEYGEIATKEPKRNLNEDVLFRFFWQRDVDETCFAQMSYSDDAVPMMGDTYVFSHQSTEQRDCTKTEPIWGRHVFASDDFLLRRLETDPIGGHADFWFQDGLSIIGWQTLTHELIDGWLNGTKLNLPMP